MPTHRILDGASEKAKGDSKIGSTLKGIGPTYRDKIGRDGLRVGDLFENFEEKYTQRKNAHIKLLETLYHYDYKAQLEEFEKEWFEGVEVLKKFKIINSEHFINNLMNEGRSAIAEGAQGTMLDIDFGSYPFVTSSNTVCAGACTGLGVAPNKIGRVFGIFKAYCTRVGMGPFPTELNDNDGQKMRDVGNEYGSTTGRPRRCGWLDLVALKYSIMVNGVTDLIMMKTDVLDGFDTIKVCTSYKINGESTTELPYELNEKVEVEYTQLPGWNSDLTDITTEGEFPKELNEYIKFIEKETGVNIYIVSVGPNRNQTIIRK